MNIYTLYITHDSNKFKIGLDNVSEQIGLDNVSEQIDISISHYNTEIFVSLFFDSDYDNHTEDRNQNQNSVVNHSKLKIKLKTLMYLTSIIKKYPNFNDCIYNNIMKSKDINEENIIGTITPNIINYIKQYIYKNKYIKIVLNNIYKVSYSYFDEDIKFKHIFYDDDLIMNKTDNPLKEYNIILQSSRILDLVMKYDTLYNLIHQKIMKNNSIKIYDIIQNDINLSKIYNTFNDNEKSVLIEDLLNIQFEKNEVKYFFIHFC